MSIMEAYTIDGMGINEEMNELNFLITDHLDWEFEPEHLLFLQEKINAYIGYIQEKQFEETYPGREFQAYVINIIFQEDVTENCFNFLETVASLVEPLSIRIVIELAQTEAPD
jgi:hypothetical protein